MRKFWVLLCALEVVPAAWLPQPGNPSLWGRTGSSLPLEQNEKSMTLSWSEPSPGYRIAGWSGQWAKDQSIVGTAIAWTQLDSVYREFEFSGTIAHKFSRRWSSAAGLDFNTAWTPGYPAWRTQAFYSRNSLSLADVLTLSGIVRLEKLSGEKLMFTGTAGTLFSLHPSYSMFIEAPFLSVQDPAHIRLGQSVRIGSLAFHNSFSWPGPVLGFGLQATMSSWRAGAGMHRSPYVPGQTGYTVTYQEKP